MTITRMQEPRQLYGLGSLVKKITKPIKKIVKSPIGKAAILGIGAFGLPGGAFGMKGLLPAGIKSGIGAALFGTPGVPDAIGKQGLLQGLMTKFGNLSTGTKFALGAGVTSLLAASGMGEEEIEETKRDPDKLRIYLKDYFSKLNPNASDEEVEQFVETNVSEYATGGRVGLESGTPKKGLDSEYATGGRVGFADGQNMKMAMSDDANDRLLEKIYEDLLDEGFSPEEAAKKAREEFERQAIAIGGRVGLESGTPKKGLESLSREDMKKFIINLPNKIEYDKDGNRIEREIPKIKGPYKYDPDRKIPIRLLRNKSAMGGLQSMPMGQMRMNEAGTIERDYRETGGFVPVGIKEKADDVPAMLSKNEFVMTADAVRGMGNGSIEKGAQKLYDQMKSLEKRVV